MSLPARCRPTTPSAWRRSEEKARTSPVEHYRTVGRLIIVPEKRLRGLLSRCLPFAYVPRPVHPLQEVSQFFGDLIRRAAGERTCNQSLGLTVFLAVQSQCRCAAVQY